MANLKFKLGPALPRPKLFHPEQTITDARFIYHLDIMNLVVHRAPKLQGDRTASGYFRLILGSKSKPRQSQESLTVVKRGIVIPMLILGLVAGLLLVVYPLLPGLTYQVQKRVGHYNNATSTIAAVDPSRNRLIIPKIGVDTTILEGPTLAVLSKYEGVWHQTGDIDHNFVIAGHRFRYLPPNTTTFYNLGQVQAGDKVALDWYGQRHLYTVTKTERVNQNDTQILRATAASQITIYTCYDRAQTQRIVVIAIPQP